MRSSSESDKLNQLHQGTKPCCVASGLQCCLCSFVCLPSVPVSLKRAIQQQHKEVGRQCGSRMVHHQNPSDRISQKSGHSTWSVTLISTQNGVGSIRRRFRNT